MKPLFPEEHRRPAWRMPDLSQDLLCPWLSHHARLCPQPSISPSTPCPLFHSWRHRIGDWELPCRTSVSAPSSTIGLRASMSGANHCAWVGRARCSMLDPRFARKNILWIFGVRLIRHQRRGASQIQLIISRLRIDVGTHLPNAVESWPECRERPRPESAYDASDCAFESANGRPTARVEAPVT